MRCTILGLALGLGATACHAGPSASATDALPLAARYAAEDAIVATVNGRAIHASDVAKEVRSGESPAIALERLLRAEVLVEEALHRGLDRDHDVQDETTRARVQRLLAGFEASHDKASIPDRELAAAYEGRKKYFVHGDMAQVWHILVPSKPTLPDHTERRLLADRVQKAAAATRTLDAFKAVGKDFTQLDGSPLVVEEVIADMETVEKNFVRAALALKQPGDVSPIVETEFGFHIIQLKQALPAQNRSLADATPELRDKLALDYRVRSFAKYVDELLRQHRIEKHDDLLARKP